jgi:hypothetical protein
MHTFLRPAQRKHFAVILLLVTALLLAHWAGLAHRVNHATQHLTQQYPALPSEGEDTGESPRHSCTAFEAAAVADLLLSVPPSVRAFAAVESWGCLAAFISREPSLFCHFSSRAPPFA